MIKPKLEVTVGFFVVVGFALLTLVVFGVSGVYFFRPGYFLKATFQYVGILDRGAPVRYAGVKVGEVKKVEILDSNANGGQHVRMTLFIVSGAQVCENDKVSIQGTHIMAEPHIEIEPAAGPRGRALKNGDEVIGVEPISMDELIHQGKEITSKINRFLSEMENQVKDSKNPDALRQSIVNLSELTASLNQIIKGNEEDLRSGLVNFSRSTAQLSDVLEKVNEGSGTLGKLVKEDELYQEVRQFVQEIKKRPWRLLKRD